MPHSASTVHDVTANARTGGLASKADGPRGDGKNEPAPEDAWRNGGLATLRAELDRIDDTVHDLLMQRAKVVEHVARSGKPAAFRPGREASIIRRLLRRHHGSLPPVSIVRIWRELLAGTTGMQGGFSLAVCDGAPGAEITQLAREHFGAATALRAYASAGEALQHVSQGAAPVAVLPYPAETDPWWIALSRHTPRLHVIARLPFWSPRSTGAPDVQALVVAATPADASGDDRSLLGLECDGEIDRETLARELSAAGLEPRTLLLVRAAGSASSHALADVAGGLADDDARLLRLRTRRPVVLGLYAVPLPGASR